MQEAPASVSATDFVLYALFTAEHLFIGVELCPIATNTPATDFCTAMLRLLPDKASVDVIPGYFRFQIPKDNVTVLMPYVPRDLVAGIFARLLERDRTEPNVLFLGHAKNSAYGFAITMHGEIVAYSKPITATEVAG